MKTPEILIVEDESVTAISLAKRLKVFGYLVTDIVDTAEDAILVAEDKFPDLVLMDINLRGEADGIKAAEEIHKRSDIPVLYLTAYSDNNTLQRAKITEPFGFLIKPFNDRELYSTIEMALFKHRAEKELKIYKNHLETLVDERTSELRKSEEENRLQKDFLLNVIESLSHPFYVIDANDYTILQANSAAKKGRLSEKTKCHSLIHGSDTPCEKNGHICPVEEVKKKRGSVTVEHIHYDNDSIKRFIEVHAFPVFDDKGDVKQVIEYVFDITERKRMMEELKELNSNLERRVSEEVNKNREKEQLLFQQSKLASMGQLMMAIAHYWRQPLTAIGLSIQDIEDAYEFGELDSKYIKKSVKETMGHLYELSNTIDNFRDLFKPDSEKTLFNIKKSIEDALSLASAGLEDASIDVRLTVEPDVPDCPEVSGCQSEFKQAVLNILNNSRDAIVEKRENSRGDTEIEGFIAIRIYKERENLFIEFIDNGTGIDEENMSRIFEPYFSTREQGRGVGLGLYLSKLSIETGMGGELFAENVTDGAKLVVLLKCVNCSQLSAFS